MPSGTQPVFTVCWLLAAAIGSAGAELPEPDTFAISPSPQYLSAVAVQADGKIIAAGGSFIERFDSEGSGDSTFNPTVNNPVYCLAVQPDGKILVGGEFSSLAGFSRNDLGRLNTNGTLDTTFAPTLSGRAQALLLQPDGKIVVGGRVFFSPVGYVGYVARLNATNGVNDATFSVTGGVAGPVASMAWQEDGKILIGGLFLSAGGQTRQHLARLNPNGSLDSTFNPGTDGLVTALAVQPDGRILVGGNFNLVAGQPRTNFARLNSDGSIDGAFDPRVTGNNGPTVYSLVVQSDGKVALGGLFTAVAGQPRQNLARVLGDGSLDTNFTTGANNFVYGLALQEDGRLVAAGEFSTLGGQPRSRIGRLVAMEPAGQSLSFDGSTLTWQRDGSSPEVWRTTFEMTTNLAQWSALGAGTRVAGGWQLGGLSLPPGGRFRARGFAAGGGFNSSSWFVETISGPCFIRGQPISRTNNAGSTAVFRVWAEGSPSLSYQWLKQAAPLPDGGRIQGAQTAWLSIGNVVRADEGSYSVVVSNTFGAITSSVALLKVVDPCVSSPLITNYANLGDTITISMTATGTAPLSFQWFKEGAALPGATVYSLTVTNVQASDIAMYSARVSNSVGSVVTNRMFLEVNMATPDAFAPAIVGNTYGLAQQPDGRIIFTGFFSSVNGQPRTCIARVDASGGLEAPFTAQSRPNDMLYCAGLQPDLKILVGGGFALWDASTTNEDIARFTAAGDLDNGFTGNAPNSILALAQQADGMIVAGGWLPLQGGGTAGYLRRLTPAGDLDAAFDPGADSVVRTLAVQPDGMILAGGGFTTLGGSTRLFIGRLNTNGTLDPSFNPGANNYVNCIAVQPDGKILVGGDFTVLAGQTWTRIGRLNADGSPDLTFNIGPSNFPSTSVYSLALQADGKILVGGQFDYLGAAPRANLGRLLPDGKPDPTFNPYVTRLSYTTLVEGVGVMDDGKVLVAGAFDYVRGQPRANLARLNATGQAISSLGFDGSTIRWSRGGTSPEVWRTAFEVSTNGTTWANVGAGTRMAGGWQLSGVSLPEGSTLRARGFVVGGNYNASSWFVERSIVVTTAPVILVNDPSFGVRSNQFNFQVRAVAGQTVVIEASSNLRDWVPRSTNQVTSTVFGFADPIYLPARFYRARVVN